MVAEIANAASAWRFLLCVMAGVLMVTLICAQVAGETLRIVFGATVMLLALAVALCGNRTTAGKGEIHPLLEAR